MNSGLGAFSYIKTDNFLAVCETSWSPDNEKDAEITQWSEMPRGASVLTTYLSEWEVRKRSRVFCCSPTYNAQNLSWLTYIIWGSIF